MLFSTKITVRIPNSTSALGMKKRDVSYSMSLTNDYLVLSIEFHLLRRIEDFTWPQYNTRRAK